jgi:hypothetical protein
LFALFFKNLEDVANEVLALFHELSFQ